jgi:hypothetical protein
MKIAVYDKKVEIKNDSYDVEIYLESQIEYLNNEKIDKNEILKFLDYLYVKIDISKNTDVYYFGENLRMWSSLLLFSYIDEKIRLFHLDREVKESNLLRLNLENIGLEEENIKNILSKEEYNSLPEFIKNLYYDNENMEECKLSEIGKLYVENIKNRRK